MSTIAKVLGNPPTNFSTTLSAGISSSDLTIPLNSVSGLSTTDGVGVIYSKDTDGDPIASSIEFIHWTGVSGNSLTLTDTGDRGVSGSASGAQAHNSGDTFEVWVHPKYYTGDAIKVEHNADGTHASTIVKTTATQTLTNKTLTSPTITGAALTSPQITTSIDDSNGNEIIKTPATASAVNEVTITNAATGNDVKVAATGDDTNINLDLSGKGTGVVKKTVRKQVVTTNSTQGSVWSQMGWSYITGDGSSEEEDITITFPTAFSTAVVNAHVQPAGFKHDSNPSNYGDTEVQGATITDIGSITTSSMVVRIRNRNSAALSDGRRYAFFWRVDGY